MDYLLNFKGSAIELEMAICVLNLIINGLPSKRICVVSFSLFLKHLTVLNLIINGLPSKLLKNVTREKKELESFKPYYKWITF